MEVVISGEAFDLLPQKAVWWKARRMLMLADLHLGKVNHFRKSGIPVPVKANNKNWENLVELIMLYRPERVLCLGDLFHSHYNFDWEVMIELVRNYQEIQFELVMGNHDVLSQHQYTRSNMRLYDQLEEGPFLLTHHPVEEPHAQLYNLAGHIHPGVRLVGRGRQSLVLPCFYFGERRGLLPAFGMFTGLAPVQPSREDAIFVIADHEIIRI